MGEEPLHESKGESESNGDAAQEAPQEGGRLEYEAFYTRIHGFLSDMSQLVCDVTRPANSANIKSHEQTAKRNALAMPAAAA
jgi:hypothetical protein